MQSLMSFSFVSSWPKSCIVRPRPKTNKHLHLRYNNIITTSYVAQNDHVVTYQKNNSKVVNGNNNNNNNNNEEVKYSKVGLQHGEEESSSSSSMQLPKHVAISLDGNRRWLKLHGLELDYRPFFQANMRFADYCLKWGVGAATSYIYGLGNMKHRTQEANDLIIGQFKSFLEEGLDKFIRNGVKVSIVGELSMLPESCQATIKKVEEATKNNNTLDLMFPMCYTSQRDIVEATKKICKKVNEGTMELEDVNEDLFEQQLSICASRPSLDMFIRMGGQIRTGMLLGWQAPHVELYFTNTYAPDFGEDVFLDALRSFQERARWFGK